MTTGRICCLVLLTLGVLAVVVVLLVTLTQPKCAPQQYLHGAVAADTETCSNIGRYVHAPLGLSVWTVCAVGLGWWTGNAQSFCPISAPWVLVEVLLLGCSLLAAEQLTKLMRFFL